MQKLRIAMIAPTEIPAHRANTVQVMKMAQALTRLGHAVCLAAPRLSPLSSQELSWESLAREYGLQRQFLVEWLPASARLRRYDFSWRAIVRARQWRADLLYTRLPQAAALGSLLRMPTILEVHDLPQGFGGPWLFLMFLKGSGARRLVVITRALADDLDKRYGLPGFGDERPAKAFSSIIAPDGVDLERYSNLPAAGQARQLIMTSYESRRPMPKTQAPRVEFPPLEGRYVVGYTGNLYAGRGKELILSLAARLPEALFIIAGGEAQEVTRLQEEVDNHRLENIWLTGYIPNADLPLYQAACDVLLMPYQQRVEASSGGDIARYLSPMKLFEYLACGRVILSSDLPVLREILNEQIAVLLPPEDIDAWETTLKSLQANPEKRLRLGEQARKAAQQYTWEARAEHILNGLKSRSPGEARQQ